MRGCLLVNRTGPLGLWQALPRLILPSGPVRRATCPSCFVLAGSAGWVSTIRLLTLSFVGVHHQQIGRRRWLSPSPRRKGNVTGAMGGPVSLANPVVSRGCLLPQGLCRGRLVPLNGRHLLPASIRTAHALGFCAASTWWKSWVRRGARAPTRSGPESSARGFVGSL